MSTDKTSQIAHTRVPNLLQDLVYPLLSGAEMACLSYIVRRTEGFAASKTERKQTDRISLSQFQDGIQTGDYVLDLGTGLSRNAIIGALDKLEKKRLVVVSRHCSRCLWKPDAQPESGAAPKEMHCGRCGRTCDRTFGLAPLSSRRMLDFLNSWDPKKRRWSFDREAMRFCIAADHADASPPPEDGGAGEDYQQMLWYPELVARAIEMLESQMRRGKTSEAQRIKHFYQPVLELQELAAHNPAVLKHALEEALSRRIPGQPRKTGRHVSQNWGWHRYPRAIVQRELARPANATRAGAVADAADRHGIEEGVRELLGRARDLNKEGNLEAARAVLSDILAQSGAVAALFEGSKARADAHLRLAFKRGQTDFVAAREALALYDFYPDWSWPEELG